MNIYDFDKTIYQGDSTIDFYLFCIQKKPLILLEIPKVLKAMIQYKLHQITKTRWKEEFYSFLHYFANIDFIIEEFWKKNIDKIADWYLNQKDRTDIIISASPEFLLSPLCKRIGVQNLIASIVDKRTGKYQGENCYGKEKVKRLLEKFPNCEIEKFYSDSNSDLPLANLAKESYIIKKYKYICKWK